MPISIRVKMTPVPGNPGEYDLEMPQELLARVTHIHRPTEGELDQALLSGEIGYTAEYGPTLMYKDEGGSTFTVGLT